MSASGSQPLGVHGVIRRAAVATVTATILVLVGCAGPPIPTQTVTVTATPDPAAVAATVEEAMAQAEAAQAAEAAAAQTDAAITPLLAWTLCVAAAQVDFGPEYWDPVDYTSDQVTDQPDGTFLATPGFAPLADQGFGAQGRCVVSGEVGDPTVDYQGGMDFG